MRDLTAMIRELEERYNTPEAAADRDAAAKQEAAEQLAQARWSRAANLDRAKDCRVTDDVREALVSRNGLRDTASRSAVRVWIDDAQARPWLVLSGGTGCGKSVAAAEYVAEHGALWVRAELLVRVFQANFGDQFEQQELIRDCRDLVLDDIGSEAEPLKMCSVLIEILDARKSRRQRTIVTTNLGKRAFAERYANERLISRLAEQIAWHGDTATDLRRPK